MRPLQILAAALCLVSLMAASDIPTKAELLKKSESANTKEMLEKALGRPTSITKSGALESWTYRAGDGSVTFIIAGDKVTFSSTDDTMSQENAK